MPGNPTAPRPAPRATLLAVAALLLPARQSPAGHQRQPAPPDSECSWRWVTARGVMTALTFPGKIMFPATKP